MGRRATAHGLIEVPRSIAIGFISSQSGVMGATEGVHPASLQVNRTGLELVRCARPWEQMAAHSRLSLPPVPVLGRAVNGRGGPTYYEFMRISADTH